MDRVVSEVAYLREKLTAEYQAAKLGLTGLAYGISQHQFITAKLENIGKIHEELTGLVGSQEAIKLVVEVLEDAENEGA